MAGEPEVLTKDEELLLAQKFQETAITQALTPLLCNRFHILPFGEFRSLVFGSAAVATNIIDNQKRYFAKTSMAVALSKSLAEELIIMLESHFNITEQDRAAVLKRSGNLSDE